MIAELQAAFEIHELFFIVLLGRRACHTEHLYTVPTECRTPGPAIDRCQHTMTMLLVAKSRLVGHVVMTLSVSLKS